VDTLPCCYFFLSAGSALACNDDSRTHLFGLTIITHVDRQIVIRDGSNQLATYTFAQHIKLAPLLFVAAIYIFSWIGWRVSRRFGRKPRKIPRGFDVIQKP